MKHLPTKQKKSVIRKAKRLAIEEAHRRVSKAPAKREVFVSAECTKDSILLQSRTGYFSPRQGPAYGLSDLDICDGIDNPGAMVQACAKVGFVVMSQLFKYTTPAAGAKALSELAEHAAKWLKLDLAGLREQLAEEKAQQAQQDAARAAASPPSPEPLPTEPPVTQSDLAPTEASPL